LFAIPADPERHKLYFKAITNYFQKEYNIKLDPSGKDVSRACYLSYDPDLFLNENYEIWDQLPIPIHSKQPELNQTAKPELLNDEEKYEKYKNIHDIKFSFVENERHNYILNLVGFLNRSGVSRNFTEIKLKCFEQGDFEWKEISDIIEHVYSKSINEFNTFEFKEDNKYSSTTQVAYIVESLEKSGRYHLAYENNDTDNLVRLDNTLNEFGPTVELIKKNINGFQLKKEDISFKDDNKDIFLSNDRIKCDFRIIPENLGYLLGANEKSKYYDKKTNTFLIANHKLIKSKPVKHQEIHDFIEQLPFSTQWFQIYLALLKNMEIALPMLYCFGFTKGGKTLIALLLASQWSNIKPDKDFFKNESFQDKAGSSPIILMDEEFPNKINLIKEMITSETNYINKKNRQAMDIIGYPRFVACINADEPHFPINKTSDIDALLRRVQVARFTSEHTQYLNGINIKETKAWIDYKFREYVAWCHENIAIPETNDLVGLIPCETDDFNAEMLNASPSHMRIIEEVILMINDSLKEDELIGGYLGKDLNDNLFKFSIGSKFTDELMDKRILKTRMSAKELKATLKKCFKNIESKRNSKNKYQNIPFKDYLKVCDELDIEPVEWVKNTVEKG